MYVGIVGAFDHVADAGEGLQEVGLAHDVGIDEGLGTAGFFVSVERIRSQDAVDDVVIHAFILEDVLQAQREVIVELAHDFGCVFPFYAEEAEDEGKDFMGS